MVAMLMIENYYLYQKIFYLLCIEVLLWIRDYAEGTAELEKMFNCYLSTYNDSRSLDLS